MGILIENRRAKMIEKNNFLVYYRINFEGGITNNLDLGLV